MPGDLMNTKELAEYLDIHEKQVYALIKSNRIPSTRVTGKWIFPKALIDKWLYEDARKGFTNENASSRSINGILAAGSNDPNLEILLSFIKKNHPEFNIFSCTTGSTEGLRLLNDNYTDAAWCHLLDPSTGGYNIPYLSTYIPGKKVAVVHLFYREIGFILSQDAYSTGVKNFTDIAERKIPFINRQPGSGTRLLADHFLAKEIIAASDINGYSSEVYTHLEVGLSIISGNAGAGLATIAIAKLFNLPFIPIVRESFDLVLTKDAFFSKEIQTFIESINSQDFKKQVKPLGNYDFGESGKIIYSTP